jgi:RNA 2',3'-cyclic 3'-phosphodiesterase
MNTLRCFIAIDSSAEIKKELQKVQEDLRMALEADAPHSAGPRKKKVGAERKGPPGKLGSREIRWVHPEGFHLTLKFLGSVQEEKLPEVLNVMGQIVPPFSPFSVNVGGVGAFPNTRDPRVIWIGVHSMRDELALLQKAVEDGLQPLGFPREARAFHPHLTLGRFKSYGRRPDSGVSGDLGKWLMENKRRECGRFEVKEVLLMKSDLKPSGAVYTPLATLHLVAPAEEGR